jgi:predicted solute-binding protein
LPKLRVGVGDVVDVKPLAWGFLKGHHSDLFSTGNHPLGMAGRMLAQGSLDIGLVPTIEVARHPDLRVIPDLCVAFPGNDGPCRTLAVIARGELSEVRRVYLGREARTSAAALRIVLADGHGADPEYVGSEPGSPLEVGEAVLRIGGAAMRAPDSRLGPADELRRYDLAKEWRDLTGLPLVTGVWAVRSAANLPELPFYFKSSLRYGLSSISAIARESAAELGIGSDELADYLRDSVTYFLQKQERLGIESLLQRAGPLGLLPEGSAIRFWPS